MDEMEQKLGAVLGNPELMQKIMAMAQSLGQPAQQSSQPPQPPEPSPAPGIDIAMLQRLSGLSRQSGIDSQQRALLSALRPYLSSERVSKLEKAMRAAKLARLASSVLGSGAIQLPSGR